MVNITLEQETILEQLSFADETFKTFRRKRRKELAEQLEREAEEIKLKRDRLAKRAYDAGIPKTRIGKQGLNTTDPHTLDRILDELERSADDGVPLDPSELEPETFTWFDEARDRVTVRDGRLEGSLFLKGDTGKWMVDRNSPGEFQDKIRAVEEPNSLYARFLQWLAEQAPEGGE